MRACLKAGLKYSTGHLATPGLWAYKIGPCQGIQMADELWMSRLLLLRITERAGVELSFDPRPLPGDWGDSCCVVEYSTKESRQPGSGMIAMQQHIAKLQIHHMQHMVAYGKHNLQRLMSKGSTSSFSSSMNSMQFTVGIGNKRASVMIPTSTLLSKCGPILDRRASSNMDPYLVMMLLASATLEIGLPAGATSAVPISYPTSSRPTGCMTSFSMVSGLSQSALSQSVNTLNTEEVLISELDKIDQFSPNTPPNLLGDASLSYSDEAYSEVCSDACTPTSDRPLSAAAKDDEMFYE
eukprot:jgi/Chrzof1/127/Cz01g04100.t1